MNIQQFLRDKDAPFEVRTHPATYTAQRMAESLHVPGKDVAKTVVLKVNGSYVLAVLRANDDIDMLSVKFALEVDSVEVAPRDDLVNLFLDCEVGSVPPFGSLYDMKTLVDESLAQDESIVFEGNTHGEAISMSYQDFAAIERPQVAAIVRDI